MSRNKEKDLQALNRFIDALHQFKKLKWERWEKLEDKVQASNFPGSPTEDWIIPPDEGKVERLLNEDQEYRNLRAMLTSHKSDIKAIAQFLREDLHHSFDWLNFSDPLIGNAALEECTLFAERLKKETQDRTYILQTFKNLFI